jgi:hypothetical protein
MNLGVPPAAGFPDRWGPVFLRAPGIARMYFTEVESETEGCNLDPHDLFWLQFRKYQIQDTLLGPMIHTHKNAML